jgi:hypothetical protein
MHKYRVDRENGVRLDLRTLRRRDQFCHCLEDFMKRSAELQRQGVDPTQLDAWENQSPTHFELARYRETACEACLSNAAELYPHQVRRCNVLDHRSA